MISVLSVGVKASPNHWQHQLIQNYYQDNSDFIEDHEDEVAGEPDKSINIVEDDIATDLEEVTGFSIITQTV